MYDQWFYVYVTLYSRILPAPIQQCSKLLFGTDLTQIIISNVAIFCQTPGFPDDYESNSGNLPDFYVSLLDIYHIILLRLFQTA